jgi:type I restriction enzyme M protein
MLTAETKRRLDACRDILVGKLPLPTDQIELITLALIYKFMDDLDEESVKLGGKRSFFTGPLEKYRWRALLPQTVSADERMNLFAEGIEAIGKAEHLPALFRDIFRNSFLKFRDGRILTLFLNEINGFVYSHSEELGNAFEYLLKTMGIQAENGQFRTPRHIIDFMVACLDPQPEDRILDPACGTGGFLVSCYKHILAKHTSPGSTTPGDKLTHEQRQKVYANLAGYDVTDLMVKLSKVNLFLHGFPDPAIHIYDTLTNDARWNEKADVILANPPFMTPRGGVSPHTKFRVSAKKSEVLFTDYIAEHLTPDGRGGVIVPNGIVATTQNAYMKLRKFLIEDSLVAVVSLPAGVFKPYSGVKTSILFLDKKLARQKKEILFLKITADGFDLGDQRREISANDLPEAEGVIKAWRKGTLSESTHASVAWKLVEKTTLLQNRSVSLQAEPFLGEGPVVGVTSFVNVADLLREVKLTNKIQKTQFLPTGRYPIIDQSENFIAGYWNDEADVFRVTEPLVLFGDHTRRFKYVNFDFVLGADGVKVLQFDERVLPRYAYFALSALKLRDLGYSRHYKELLAHEVPLPPLEEQRRIVAEIESYQKIINGARQILAEYRAEIPTADDWPTIELRELIQEKPKNGYSGKPVWYATKTKVLSLTATTSGKLDISKFKYLDEDIAPDASCRCREGDIYLQRGNTKELVGTAALFDSTAADFIYPDLMIRVRADEAKILRKFLLHTLQSESVRQFLMKNASGAAGSMPKINQAIVERIPIRLPPLHEQARVVAELDAEAAQIESVRGLISKFESKIDRVLDCVWGNNGSE